ncbi:hypothetical protein MSTE_00781 [Mycobacteroides stephanolepidis]|uniref:Uncharacterized protein n=1 Tax=[Mycobacterium] stephanolepidis TaxID=1520670 RepID=A0A1Z4ET18_9MYCO|nr:hypothetical protein MSTE_00781 [[Mycobacterium] stephanolepidis]
MLISAIAVLSIFAVWMGWHQVADGPGHRKPTPPPKAFTDRTPLPSCGSYTFGFNSHAVPATQKDCMNVARASGRGGELKIVESTIEGDPVTTYYRVFSPQQQVEIFIDYSGDQFSNFGWSHFFCWAASTDYRPNPSCPDPALQPDR